MGTNADGFARLNLLALVLRFGMVLLIDWRIPWRVSRAVYDGLCRRFGKGHFMVPIAGCTTEAPPDYGNSRAYPT
jgi:hypothetical protein